MTTLNYLLCIACAFVFWTCNFSVGTKKDLNTGLSYTYNGFSIESVVLAEESADGTEKELSSNKVNIRQKIAILLQGISGYTLKEGKVFPGLMMEVMDKNGTAILHEDDLFLNAEGLEPDVASHLSGSLTMGHPMEPGNTYHMRITAWDKMKTESRVTAEVDLVVQ